MYDLTEEKKMSEPLITQISLIMENKAGKVNLWNPLISVICDSDNVRADGREKNVWIAD